MSSPELTSHTFKQDFQMRPPAWLWPLALGLLVLLLAGLGRAPLFDVDEGAFSEATREMLASGDWGHTTLNVPTVLTNPSVFIGCKHSVP